MTVRNRIGATRQDQSLGAIQTPTTRPPAGDSAQRHLPQGVQHLAAVVYLHSLPLVLVIILLMIFPSPYLVLGLVGSLLLFIIRWIGTGSPFPLSPVNGTLTILFASLLIGLVLSPDLPSGVLVAAQAVAGLTLFFAIYDWAQTRSRVWMVVAGVVLLGVAIALTAPFTTLWTQSKLFQWDAFYERGWLRFAETSNANSVAGGLEAAVPLALALIASGKRGGKLLGAIALPPLIVMLILIQSRGALLAVALGLAVYVTLYKRWLLPLIPIVLLAALALNAGIGAPIPTQTFYDRNVTSAPENFEGRSAIWRQALPLIVRAPWGLGVDGFKYVAETRLTDVLAAPQRGHAHNLFLQIALDTGVVGLLAFIITAGFAVRQAWRVFRRSTDAPDKALAVGLLAACAVMTTHGMMDTIFWGFKPGVVMWSVLAAALALGSQVPSDPTEPEDL